MRLPYCLQVIYAFVACVVAFYPYNPGTSPAAAKVGNHPYSKSDPDHATRGVLKSASGVVKMTLKRHSVSVSQNSSFRYHEY